MNSSSLQFTSVVGLIITATVAVLAFFLYCAYFKIRAHKYRPDMVDGIYSPMMAEMVDELIIRVWCTCFIFFIFFLTCLARSQYLLRSS